jgi:hypothetical protein
MHHDDYAKPLEVHILCRVHHCARHGRRKARFIPPEDRPVVAKRLSRARIVKGDSIEEAAGAIGRTPETVWRWEQGLREPTGLSIPAVEKYIQEAERRDNAQEGH